MTGSGSGTLLQFQSNPLRFRKNKRLQEPPSSKGEVLDPYAGPSKGFSDQVRRKGQRRMSWGEGSLAPANDEIQGWGQAQSLGESWCAAGSKGHAGGQIVCSQRYAEIPAPVGMKGWKMLTYTEL